MKFVTTCIAFLGVAVSCSGETIPNDVYLSEYVPAGDRDGKIINFGQAGTFIYDDLEILPTLNVPFGFGWVEFGDVITQSTREIGLPAELAPGETKYFGFVTLASDVRIPPVPWETIGWMQLTRTADTGELLLLGSATNYGELLDPDSGARGPASGITVGLVPEPAFAGWVMAALACLISFHRRGGREGRYKS